MSDIALWYVDMRRRQDGISGPAEIHQIGFDLPRLNTGMYTILSAMKIVYFLSSRHAIVDSSHNVVAEQFSSSRQGSCRVVVI